MSTAFLPTRYDPDTVWVSFAIASLASYVALDLARHVRGRAVLATLVWCLGGALAMGTGIWSMHFVGMIAFRLPIEVGYDTALTFLSWVAAVGVSAIALYIATRERLDPRTLTIGALAMGGGICAMHYTGMAALRMAPGIVWNLWLVAASALIACGASAVALLIFFGMRRLHGLRARLAHVGAALVMGTAIGGMHYTGMAAANFAADAICLSVDGVGRQSLGVVTGAASLILVAVTVFTSVLDGSVAVRTAELARELQSANAQLQRANDDLGRLAFVDALTELPNRTLFDDRLQHALARIDRHADEGSTREAVRLALLFVDLDGFKPVNDSFGHAAGDVVLRQVAQRLRALVRGADTVARMGGDEFVLLMDGLHGADDAIALGRRILQTMREPFELPERQVSLSCSIGIVVYPDHGHRDQLIACADAAMYNAKRAGGSTFALFEAELDSQAGGGQFELQQDLRAAIGAGELLLHYQPKISAASGRLSGLEALVRWQHPRHGLLGPAAFIPVAERFGLIVELGDWVLDEACRQLAAWSAAGQRLRVSVNMSAQQLRQEDLTARLSSTLGRHGVDPDQLVCEITETLAMEDTQATQRVVEQFIALGIRLSIDDFGTGYSSLAYLRRLRAHEVKIDRSFVADLEASADARAVVDAVVRLSHALGLQVVAEGVETVEQRDVLVGLGCDELQGYYFARPMAPQALIQSGWLDGHAECQLGSEAGPAGRGAS
ncbi:MAG: EAL domain-containing protein [Pseudomonadota bacterium]